MKISGVYILTLRSIKRMIVVVAATMPLMADTGPVGGYTWTDGINGEAAENMV